MCIQRNGYQSCVKMIMYQRIPLTILGNVVCAWLIRNTIYM